MDPDYSLAVRAACEFIGTAILIIIGNGTVANVHLKGSKGYGGGWSLIAMGYGFGVMIPALMFGGISGNHINPAFTIGLATWGMFPWADVAPYVVAQMLGAMAGQLAIVATHKPYYDRTESLRRRPRDLLDRQRRAQPRERLRERACSARSSCSRARWRSSTRP